MTHDNTQMIRGASGNGNSGSFLGKVNGDATKVAADLAANAAAMEEIPMSERTPEQLVDTMRGLVPAGATLIFEENYDAGGGWLTVRRVRLEDGTELDFDDATDEGIDMETIDWAASNVTGYQHADFTETPRRSGNWVLAPAAAPAPAVETAPAPEADPLAFRAGLDAALQTFWDAQEALAKADKSDKDTLKQLEQAKRDAEAAIQPAAIDAIRRAVPAGSSVILVEHPDGEEGLHIEEIRLASGAVMTDRMELRVPGERARKEPEYPYLLWGAGEDEAEAHKQKLAQYEKDKAEFDARVEAAGFGGIDWDELPMVATDIRDFRDQELSPLGTDRLELKADV